MTSFFQEGDTTSDGYSYLQLKDIGLTLPYLQLSRIMPAGLDTMKALSSGVHFFY
ncbi:MAG: hypothetical protein IPP46_12700 [Bacteroidetes bacterium]|nr:hypothetical protein [Bacteroidota bacterium]